MCGHCWTHPWFFVVEHKETHTDTKHNFQHAHKHTGYAAVSCLVFLLRSFFFLLDLWGVFVSGNLCRLSRIDTLWTCARMRVRLLTRQRRWRPCGHEHRFLRKLDHRVCPARPKPSVTPSAAPSVCLHPPPPLPMEVLNPLPMFHIWSLLKTLQRQKQFSAQRDNPVSQTKTWMQ